MPPLPSGYEAVLPTVTSPSVPTAPYSAPAAPYVASSASSGSAAPYDGAPAPTVNPFTPPQGPVGPFAGLPQQETQTPVYGAQPGYGSPYGPAPTGAAYGTAPGGSPYGAPPTAGHPAFASPGYGQPPGYGGSPYNGAPPYGTPYGVGPYGSYGTPPSSQTEPLAVASIATSLGGLILLGGLPGVVGLVLGIVALRRIRVNGKQGRGLAITGIVAGSLGIAYLLIIGLFIVGLVAEGGPTSYGSEDYGSSTGDGSSDDEVDDTLPPYSLRTDLQVGNCLDVYSYEWDMSDTNVISCTLPHEGEVLSLVTMTGPSSESLTAADPVWEAAMDECSATADALLRERVDELEVVLFAPHPDQFAGGATTAYCTYFTYEGQISGSAVEQTLTPAPGSTT